MATATLTKGALWMQNADYSADWDRTLIDALYAAEGVIDGFLVTPNGGLGIAVSAGRAVVKGDEIENQGKYFVDQDAVVTMTLASVGVTRTEYVYISVNDTAVAGGRAGNNVTIDTSTSVPPASALLIATLTLTGGTVTIAAGMVADSRAFADVVAPASITAAKIAPGAVGITAMAAAAVITAKIADANVTTAKIANLAVTTAKLDAILQARMDAMDPADAITAISGSTAPAGWVLCDGGSYNRATFAATFARTSTVYGAVDGESFNVPDLRNRSIVMRGPATWSDTLDEAGGSADAVAVAHTHGSDDHSHSSADHTHYTGGATSGGGGHSHTANGNGFVYWANAYGSGAGSIGETGSVWALSWQSSVGGGGHEHNWGATSGGASTGNTTGGANSGVGNTTNSQSPSAAGANANLPPYRTLNYIHRMR